MALRLFSDIVGSAQVVPNVQYLGTLTTIAQVPTSSFGTITGISVECDRWGRYLKVVGKFIIGTAASAPASMTLPFSLTSGTVASFQIIGKWWRDISAATTRKTGNLFITNGSATIFFGNDDNAAAPSPGTSLNADSVGASGGTILFEYEVPITSYALDAWIAQGAGQATGTRVGLISGEEWGTFSAAVSGSTSAGFVNVVYARAGKKVTLYIDQINWTSISAAAYNISMTNAPSTIRIRAGSANTRFLIPGVSPGGVFGIGICQLTPANLAIYSSNTGSNWPASGAQIIYSYFLTYIID